LPPRSDDRLLPVIVMLHGCTQDAADFATGTAMNELAEQRGCIVVYPEQLARSNSMRCWNWFDPSHQHRGRGEPAMIAALAAHVVQRCQGDPRRVYVAGLSAGGAMAALVAQIYPDVFAAVGVHSGLPAGAASDVPSAHAAMRRPARTAATSATSAAVVPTIVFHGDSDRTVHPDNGRHLIAEAVARASASGIALVPQEQTVTVAGRIVRRTTYSDPLGVPRVEHWAIPGGSHAWSGGRAAGTFTEPSGPSASGAMIDFFLAQQLPPGAALAT
jgi:poly(hydroxyalkanoate) depolymerase family esterase